MFARNILVRWNFPLCSKWPPLGRLRFLVSYSAVFRMTQNVVEPKEFKFQSLRELAPASGILAARQRAEAHIWDASALRRRLPAPCSGSVHPVRRSPQAKTSSLTMGTPHNSEIIMGWRRAAPGFCREIGLRYFKALKLENL